MKTVERPEGVVDSNRQIEWSSDIAAEMLRRLEVPYVSLNPGASYRGFHDSLVNYLGNRAPQMLLCLHEDHVVSIAHGYAKATDRPMACVLHSNVGLMHGLMGIYNAWCDRVPMIVVGATGPVVPEKRRPWIDWIHTAKDQGALLRNYVKWDDEPRSSAGIVDAFIRGAHLTSEEPRAPIYICLDAGLQEERVEAAPFIPDSRRFKPAPPPCATEVDVRAVVERVAKAERPVFLFGRGSRRQVDWQQRIELAEFSGASVVTSVLERAVFPTDHGLHLGPPIDRLGTHVRYALAEADLIVAFEWVDLNGLLQQIVANPAELGASLIAVSLDNALHNGWSMDHFGLAPADIRIAAGADAFVGQLLAELKGGLKGRPRWDGSTRNERVKCTYSPRSKDEIAPTDIEIALAEIRGDRRFTVAHVGFAWSGSAYRYRDPLDFLGHDGGAGLAAGPGLTVGAALALKDSGRPVISVMGDGDFLQGASALWTAAHYRIPALFIVSNNRSNFNDEIHQNTMAKVRNRPQQNRWIGQSMTDPEIDLAAIARAQGVQGVGPVKNVPDLLAAVREGLDIVAAGRPYFIDAWVSQTEMPEVAPRGRATSTRP
jgi:thiamine pyrophosphate-dependent acetolactate synthase large subunit-like protein